LSTVIDGIVSGKTMIVIKAFCFWGKHFHNITFCAVRIGPNKPTATQDTVSTRKKLVEPPDVCFKHLKMLNSASKCLIITLKVIKFSKPEKQFPKKLKLMGGHAPTFYC
jgi:hypothetical protein